MKKKILSFLIISIFSFTAIYGLCTQKSYAVNRCSTPCGFVDKSFLEAYTGDPNGEDLWFAKVKLTDTGDWSYLNVREEPSLNGPIIDKLKHGTKVQVRGEQIVRDGITWVWVRY